MRRVDLVVTRHQTLVEYARGLGLVDSDTPVLAHVTVADVRGKRVLGVLPLHLAREAARVIEIPLALEPADRNAMRAGDLPLDRMREIARPPVEYSVCDVADVTLGDLDAMETSRMYGWGLRGAR